MSESSRARVAIVDYGMGNLYSVQRACAHVGLRSAITASPDDVLAADAVILPGVGAMPVAIRTLHSTGLADALLEIAARGTPLFGICLGLQLLMREGSEFERHAGLGILDGEVVRFQGTEGEAPLRVPHIGWSPVRPEPGIGAWADTPLEAIPAGSLMYFVHSYYVVPSDAAVVAATTTYGSVRFVSAIARDNIFACQFHPERSGAQGLAMYRRFASLIRTEPHLTPAR